MNQALCAIAYQFYIVCFYFQNHQFNQDKKKSGIFGKVKLRVCTSLLNLYRDININFSSFVLPKFE